MALVLGLTFPAVAAPRVATPKLVMVEVDDYETSFHNHLSPATSEPGGLLVPTDVTKEWLDLGLVPGDVIRFANGSPVGDNFYISDGVTVLDVLRQGKPLLIHIVAHGKSTEKIDLTADQFKDLVDATAKGPISIAMQLDGKPTGVRLTEMLVTLYIHLEVGDIVRSIDGVPIHSDAELVSALHTLRLGSTNILIDRADRPISITVQRAAANDLTKIKNVSKNHYELPRALVKALSDEPQLMTQQIKLVPVAKNGSVHGHKVFGIESGSVAAAAGLQNDDVVLDINGKPLDTSEEAYSANFDASSERELTLHIERKGKPLALVYTVVE